MKTDIIIMNFSHAYERERSLLSPDFRWLDCTHIEGSNCYCDSSASAQITSLLAPFDQNGIHLIDSGNYHYLTKFWTDKIQRPFSLVVFDHHPDMQPPLFDGILSCGSWVREMLDSNLYLHKVLIIGASEQLQKETAGYKDRIFYFGEQYLHHPQAWEQFSSLRIQEPVYISVDKDVLSPQYAISDWDQGSLTLVELEKLLHTILQHEEILGIDICGDCAHPLPTQSVAEEQMINESTNHELIHFIGKALSLSSSKNKK